MRSLAVFALAFAALIWPGGAMAETPRLFTVAGGSTTGPLKFGRLATTVSVDPATVLGLPDGGFAFYDVESNRVLRVDQVGRIHLLAGDGHNGSRGNGGPATRARLWWADDLALHPDGILIADDIDGTVRLVRHDGIIVRVVGSGALEARGLALAANGDLLIAGEDRVRRLSPDGKLSTFAGNGESGSGGDGGPATQAQLNPATSVAIAADGSAYIATYGALRRVSPAGIISTVARRFWLERLAMTPTGLVAATGEGDTDEIVVRVAPDGTIERIAGGRRVSAFDGDGESPLGLRFGASDVSPAADGGLLIAAFDSIRYLPPEHPQRLAVAITRPTLTSPRRLRVSLALTMPAATTVRVTGRGVKVAPIHAALGAGDATLRVRRRLPAGTYDIRVTARGADGQLATDRQAVFPGGVLSIGAARVVAAERLREVQALLRPSPPGRVGKCRRFGRKRVDCRIILRGYGCWEVASIRLRTGTGLPYVRTYDHLLDGVCRFHR